MGVPGRRRLEEPEEAWELMLTIIVLLEADYNFHRLPTPSMRRKRLLFQGQVRRQGQQWLQRSMRERQGRR